jgi:hypothetical protein
MMSGRNELRRRTHSQTYRQAAHTRMHSWQIRSNSNSVRGCGSVRTQTHCDDRLPLPVQSELDGDVDDVVPKIVRLRDLVQ